MEEQNQITFRSATKKLKDLEPPSLRLDTAYYRYTADLQRINNFFWSTEIAYASIWNANSFYQESGDLASVVLEESNANAFMKRSTKHKPHYTGKMGSLLVQLRWNYDALGRYALIEVMSCLEVYIKERLTPILGKALASKHLNAIQRELGRKEILLDPELTYRLWILKEIRNDLVHDRSTVHTFPSNSLMKRIENITKQSSKWSNDDEWEKRQDAAHNEMLLSSKYRAQEFDLPQAFFIAIYALSWSGEFVHHLESLLRAARHRNIKYKKPSKHGSA